MFFDFLNKKVIAKTVDRSRILYKDGRKKMYISFEWVTPNGATRVDTYSVKRWEIPYDQEKIDEKEKYKILSNIKEIFEKKGLTVEFY